MKVIKCDICGHISDEWIDTSKLNELPVAIFPSLWQISDMCFECGKKVDAYVGLLIDQSYDFQNIGVDIGRAENVQGMQPVLPEESNDK